MSKSGSKKTWICPEGCKLDKSACVHLNALIDEKRQEPMFETGKQWVNKDIDKAYYESGAGYIIPENIKNRSYEYSFRNKMFKAGLEQIKVDILTLKYVYEMSFREIAAELGITSVTTTVRLHEEALKTIKKRGLPSEMD